MKFISFLFLICSSYVVCAQSPELIALKNEWKQLQNEENYKKAHLSFSLMRCDRQEFIIKENTKVLSPASNLKLVTTATALNLLGPDFRYETVVEYEGILRNDTLIGDIYIRGSGDPSLGSERLTAPYLSPDSIALRWAKAIKKSGIRVLKGRIIADLSATEYNPLPDNWPWGDMGNYYGAGVFALNIADNMYRVYFNGGAKENDPATVQRIVPDPGFKQVINEVLSGPVGSGDEGYLYAAPYAPMLYMKGTIPAQSRNFAVRGSIPDPASLLCRMVLRRLAEFKVTVMDTTACTVYSAGKYPRKVIDSYMSPPLSELARLTNVFSLNLYAECMVRTLGKKFGKEGSTIEGVRVIKEHWQNKGLDVSGWHMYDGSGLSFNNSISTQQLSWILASMKKEKYFDAFYQSFPVAGVSGTVYRLGRGSALAGNGRVKSGSLSKVTCYSGYVTSVDGVLMSFALFSNQYDGSSSAVIAKFESLLKKVATLSLK